MKSVPFAKAFFVLLSIFIFPFSLVAVERNIAVVAENIISTNWEDFDCHSSCLIETSPGVLCAVWKGGPGKGKSNFEIKQNVGIWLSIFKDGLWNEPKQIVQAPDSVCWTPVLARSPTGSLILFYRIGIDPRHSISMVKTSVDGGFSWSDEEMLPAGIIGPTKSKPLFDADGNMICGSSVEVGDPDDKMKATASWIEIFSGCKWSKYGPIEIPGKKFGCIEPALFFGENGEIKMLCRDRSHRIGIEGWIWKAESKDGGRAWSELQQTTLPNPDSGIEVLALDNEKVLLIYNHSHQNRYPLSLALSQDGGESWNRLLDIEKESGEFPSATLDYQGYLHVSYAWTPPGKHQRQIKHVVLDLNKILSE